ncbi:MAG: PocR ligand-binding domain-containing protein [Candidatus Sumerlaeota bacterium]|nr:PocR ligand-binding domain-containing protein [Candidatus Sumerlaeota bacterium]
MELTTYFQTGTFRKNQFFNKVCWEYRQQCSERECLQCDHRIAQEYIDGTREGFSPYPCWLGMDDLAFPLRIGGKVWGVLFAGQIVPNDDARLAQIEANILQRVTVPVAERLIQLLREERRAQWGSDPQYSETMVRRLSEFGNMVQQILTQLYEAHRTAAEQELLQSIETELASANLADAGAWWSTCDQLLRSVADFFGLQEIHVYLRDRSRYYKRIRLGEAATEVPVREVLSTLTAGQFKQAVSQTSTVLLAESLAVPANTTSFYVSYVQAEGTPLTTFLVLCGDLHQQYANLIQSICRIVTQKIDYLTLVQRQRQAQKEYRMHVAQVAHDFRTPLQIILLDLEDVRRVDAVIEDAELLGRVTKSIIRATGAEEHVLRLLGVAVEKREVMDLVALVRQVMDDLEPLAKKHPCCLARFGTWPSQALVRGIKFQIRSAMTNLIENAIKYSYTGRITDGRFEPERVKVQVELQRTTLCVFASRITVSGFLPTNCGILRSQAVVPWCLIAFKRGRALGGEWPSPLTF